MAYQKVLIVDDSKMVRTAISRVIRDTFEVREEVDGEGGWNAIDGDPLIVAVISDISMPGLDGFGLLQRIRNSTTPRVRDLPVIMISGNKDDATKKRARAAGANDFITKGSDGSEIVARIDNLLRLVQAKNDLQALKLNDVDEIWDPLTGTFTGDYLRTEGGKHFSHARRHNTALSIVTFRVDNHGDIERRMGKELAGQLLTRVAKLVQGTLRAEDSVGRTGDAQFSMIFPSTATDQALVFARRLRDQLENARVRHNDQVIKLTTYMGVASLTHDKADSFEDLMKAALTRLERAAKNAAQAIDSTGSFNVQTGSFHVSETNPAAAPSSNIAYVLKALENASAERTREVLKQMLPSIAAACRRLKIDFPGDAIARELDRK